MSPDLILVVRCWYLKNSKNSFMQINNPFPGPSILADVAIFLEIFQQHISHYEFLLTEKP